MRIEFQSMNEALTKRRQGFGFCKVIGVIDCKRLQRPMLISYYSVMYLYRTIIDSISGLLNLLK